MRKIVCFIYIFILTTACFQLHAQQSNTSLDTDLTKGKELLFYGKYKDAILVFNKALKQAESLEDSISIAGCYNALSKAYNYTSQLKESMLYAEKAMQYSQGEHITQKKEEADALFNLGIVQGQKRFSKESLENHTAALEIRQTFFKDDLFQIANSHFNVGVALHRQRRLAEAMKKFETTLTIELKDTPQRSILHADIYEAIGYINYDLGKFDKALTFFKKTLHLAQQTYEDNHPYFGKVYNELGMIYSMKNEFNKSLKYYNKSLSVSIANHGIDMSADQVRVHFNIGTIYEKLDIQEKAIFHTKKSLAIGTKILGATHPQMFYPYSQLGTIYGDERGIPYVEKALAILLGSDPVNFVIVSFQYEYLANIYSKVENYPESLKYMEKTLELRLQIFGERNINTIRSYNNLAKTYAQLKEFDKALLYCEKSIAANTLNIASQQNLTDSFTSVNYVDQNFLVESVKTKADILVLLYQERKEKKHLLESIKLYDEADALASLTRKSKQNHDDRIQFSETVKAIYAKNIQTKLLLSEIENNTSSLVETFYASEKSRSHTLRELLKQSEVKRTVNIHTDIISLEKTINIQLAKLQSEIVKEATALKSDSVKIYQLEGKVFDLTKRKDSLEKRIEIDFPKYYKLKYEDTVIEISTLQEKLNDSTTLIEFFKNKNAVYTFIITKKSFHVKRVEVDDLDSKIEALNKAITDKNTIQFTKYASNLYTELLSPIKSHFVGNELIIIPDESLWHIQFDLLLTEATKANQKPAYLLYNYAISYANSASLLFDETAKSTTHFSNECVAFSYTSKDTILKNNNTIALSKLRNTQVDLPGTRKEIQEISNILEGTYFYGNAANEMNFKKYAGNSNILHLALHGDIDNNNSNNLKIYFSEGSPNDDDKLFGHELYSLHIPANLVVLSACNTGNGQINKVEGIQSLGNAFQYAGAKSLLLSSWEISDKTTPEIMRYFYEHIKGGMPKHKALQQAKIDFLQNADTFNAAPFYWGSFYLLGDTAPIPFSTFNYTVWIIGIVSSIVLFLIARSFLRRKNNTI
ncbi:CHAT domain-containing protein [Kordia sp.]|uniref:CHAT domain-containing protein n=1 Tax=Kordia sp. TaxID=1965332 RepID=UPI003D6C3FA4